MVGSGEEADTGKVGTVEATMIVGLDRVVVTGREGFCSRARVTLTEQDVKKRKKDAEGTKCSGLTRGCTDPCPWSQGKGEQEFRPGWTVIPAPHQFTSTWNLKM